MPAAKKAAAAKLAAPAKSTSDGRLSRALPALDGIEISLDDAQKAIGELRKDISAGGRSLLKDVETAVKHARRDVTKARKAVQSDIGDLGEALTPRRKPAAKTKPKARAAA